VRIVVAQNDCMRWPCVEGPFPWSAEAVLPALFPDGYVLPIELAVVSMCDSTLVDTVYHSFRPFTVRDSCDGVPHQPCFIAGWDHSGRTGRCDARVGPDQPARVAMTLSSPVPLAGLQGRLILHPPGLRITRLEPIGPAQGMHIAWEPRPDGAEFLMFADQGAPLGGVRGCVPGTRCEQPVLAVTLLPAPDAVPAPVTHLVTQGLLGSDSLGQAVPECQIATLVMVSAEICAGASCDFNQDGMLDVRDLVTMVHCVLGVGGCPDTALARPDCNGDGRLNVDDVLCCARTILHHGVRDTTHGRPEPGVGVALGGVAWHGDLLDVSLSLSGSAHVGAARLAFDFPVDRYEVGSLDLGAPGWLALHDVVDGRLVIGLIGLGLPGAPQDGPGSDLQVMLRLKPRPGQAAGGEISLADAQFAGTDGAALEVAVTPVVQTLPDPGARALSPAWPNPFTRTTQFTLNLDRGADADVAIHDLSGRRVTTLWHGALGAGPHAFTWRGERSDGSAAPNGIYFVKARVAGEQLTRKVVFLPGN
jgi:hypothetical protein